MKVEDLDKILGDIAQEEEKKDYADEWWCMDCEHGPMDEKDNKCSRCGTRNSQYQSDEEITGWEDEDIESEVEEIW